MARGREQLEQLELRPVYVLVLVDEDMRQRALQGQTQPALARQQPDGISDQVVEVQQAARRQRARIGRRQFGQPGVTVFGISTGRIAQVAFVLADEIQHPCGGIGLQAEILGPGNLCQQLDLSALVCNDEVRVEAGRVRVTPQDARAKRVERIDPDITGCRAQQAFEAPLHLLGRPVSESDAEHLLRCHILRGYQPGGAPGDDVSLAAAGSGEHEQGSGRRSHCRQL